MQKHACMKRWPITDIIRHLTWCLYFGQVYGSLPAGLEKLPLLVNTRHTASPVSCAGKKHSIMATMRSLRSAHVIFTGPPLKRRRTTGTPFANRARPSMKKKIHENSFIHCICTCSFHLPTYIINCLTLSL